MGQKLPYLGIFGLEFEKHIVIFEISTFEFIYMQSFMLNKKKLNLGPKLPFVGIFALEFEKTIVIFENSTLKFVKKKVSCKRKKL